jgi:hypothetical protein
MAGDKGFFVQLQKSAREFLRWASSLVVAPPSASGGPATNDGGTVGRVCLAGSDEGSGQCQSALCHVGRVCPAANGFSSRCCRRPPQTTGSGRRRCRHGAIARTVTDLGDHRPKRSPGGQSMNLSGMSL